MSIIEKLGRINSIKTAIQTAIAGKGVVIDSNTPFADYPSKIASITSGPPIDTQAPVLEVRRIEADGTKAVFKFNEDIALLSLDLDVLANNVKRAYKTTISGNTLTIKPDMRFFAGQTIKIVYRGGLVDRSGNQLAPVSWDMVNASTAVMTPIEKLQLKEKNYYIFDFSDPNQLFQSSGENVAQVEGQPVHSIASKGHGPVLILKQDTPASQPKIGFNPDYGFGVKFGNTPLQGSFGPDLAPVNNTRFTIFVLAEQGTSRGIYIQSSVSPGAGYGVTGSGNSASIGVTNYLNMQSGLSKSAGGATQGSCHAIRQAGYLMYSFFGFVKNRNVDLSNQNLFLSYIPIDLQILLISTLQTGILYKIVLVDAYLSDAEVEEMQRYLLKTQNFID